MTFEVRKATKEDGEGIGIVHYQSWLETYRGILDDRFLDELSIERRIEAAQCYYEDCWVAEVDGEMVGFVHCHVSRDNPNVYEIIALYIFKAYQKLGIGKALIQKCLDAYPNKSMCLWVAKENRNACDAYEKLKFVETQDNKCLRIGEKDVEILKLEYVK